MASTTVLCQAAMAVAGALILPYVAETRIVFSIWSVRLTVHNFHADLVCVGVLPLGSV